MRRLDAAIEALGWASHYRRVQQDKSEQHAAQMALAADKAQSELAQAQEQRAAASNQCLRIAEAGQTLDPMLGRLWHAEFDRCCGIENGAEATRDRADEDLALAVSGFLTATVIADDSEQSFVTAKKQLARKAEERRLSELADLLTQRWSRR